MANPPDMEKFNSLPDAQSGIKPTASVNLLEANSPGGEKMVRGSVVSINSDESEEILDLFEPFPELPGQIKENDRVFTIRAMLVGSLLGCLVTASNTYLGLWTLNQSVPCNGN